MCRTCTSLRLRVHESKVPTLSYSDTDSRDNYYSLRPIILFANIDVSRHILVIDTSVFVKSNMGRREYYNTYSTIHAVVNIL
jgi:hypothetical protein